MGGVIQQAAIRMTFKLYIFTCLAIGTSEQMFTFTFAFSYIVSPMSRAIFGTDMSYI